MGLRVPRHGRDKLGHDDPKGDALQAIGITGTRPVMTKMKTPNVTLGTRGLCFVRASAHLLGKPLHQQLQIRLRQVVARRQHLVLNLCAG